MFLLDTNILSGMMRVPPVPQVANWLAEQDMDRVYTAAVCQAEILAGLAIMPEGRRRRDLEAAARGMFLDDFDGRIFPFNKLAADAYADIFAANRRAGRAPAIIDLMLAAIAHSNGASVVTRNVADFTACFVPIINPWDI